MTFRLTPEEKKIFIIGLLDTIVIFLLERYGVHDMIVRKIWGGP